MAAVRSRRTMVLLTALALGSPLQAQSTPDTRLAGATVSIGFDKLIVDEYGLTLAALRITNVRPGSAGADFTIAISPQGLLLAPELGAAVGFSNETAALLVRFGLGALIGEGGFVPEAYAGIGVVVRLSGTIGMRFDVAQHLLSVDRGFYPASSLGVGFSFVPRPRQPAP